MWVPRSALMALTLVSRTDLPQVGFGTLPRASTVRNFYYSVFSTYDARTQNIISGRHHIFENRGSRFVLCIVCRIRPHPTGRPKSRAGSRRPQVQRPTFSAQPVPREAHCGRVDVRASVPSCFSDQGAHGHWTDSDGCGSVAVAASAASVYRLPSSTFDVRRFDVRCSIFSFEGQGQGRCGI
ncbi:hypothetical protein C8Q76DRAFT_724038 [Earliella scabrosa]|nr:hypothetical protein C8Q76DRAFT_724038 [Earliella scabrosa]